MVLETPQNFIFDRGEVDLLIVHGPEANDFLSRLSTVNFKEPILNSLHGAFLTGQAKLISLFTAWQKNGKNYLFIEREMFVKTQEYLQQMHFAENLKIETKKYFCTEVRGNPPTISCEFQVDAYNWGLPGKYLFDTTKFELKSILPTQYDVIRAKYGFPKPLVDLTDDHILIEGGMDQWIDRNKGCYPGQEVIEKIYTYGRVARKIKKVIFENLEEGEIESFRKKLPLEIDFDGNNVGTITSAYFAKKGFGLATLKRHFCEKHSNFQISHNNKMLNGSIEEN